MARATVYKSSSGIVPAESTVNEVDPLDDGIKNEPTSPSMPHSMETDTSELLSELEGIEANASKQRAPDTHEPMEIVAETSNSSVSSPSKQQGSDIIENKELSQTRKKRRVSSDDFLITDPPLGRLRCRSSLSGPIIFKCDVCLLTFRREIDVQKHKNYYDRKVLRCTFCGENFTSPMQMMSHRKSAHRNVDWKFRGIKCHLCKLSFHNKSSLQPHIFHFHGDPPRPMVRRRSRAAKSEASQRELPVVESARDVRKRKRDQLIEEKGDLNNSPSNSTSLPQSSAKPDEGTSPSKDKSPNRRSQNKEKPLVKIHAIPHEVEALLSDYDDSAVKRRKIDDSGDISIENVRAPRLRSGRLRDEINPEGAIDHEINDEVPKNDAKETPPVKKTVDSPFKPSSILHTPGRLVTRKWAMLKTRYKCRECFVSLERIDNRREEEEALDDSSIGVQLKNLEIALKKLDVPENSQDAISKGRREIYRSSLCRTRFTKKQRLINHYLCFHTNLNQDECGVCRLRCGNSRKLKNHLSLHCIKIPKSKQDRSPIDPKGPCEKYRKKNFCGGCKKRFWLLSCLRKHEEFCRFLQRAKTPQEEEPEDSQPIESAGNESLETDTNVSDRIEPAPAPPIPDVNVNVTVNETEVHGKLTFKPEPNRSWELRLSRGIASHLCDICNANFGTDIQFVEHHHRYVPRNPTRCMECGTLFPSRQLQKNHYKSAHTLESLNFKLHCSVCYQGFASKKYLRSHILHIHWDQMNKNGREWFSTHGKYEMKCKVCTLVFNNRKDFIEHAMYYYDDEFYKCNLCEKSFVGRFRYHAHWKSVHYTKEIRKSYTHYCGVCNEGFMYKFHLHSHLSHVHHQGDDTIEASLRAMTAPFVCSACEEKFPTAVLLSKHQNVHSNDGKYECNKCSRKCRSVSILANHYKASHSDNPNFQSAKCPICSEGMVSKVSWMSHIKHVHEKPMDKPNELCLERIYTLDQLITAGDVKKSGESVIHVGSTSAADALVYEDDDAMSISEELLNIEYTCAICDEKFVSMEELKNHKSIHEPSNYGCEDIGVNVQQDERSRDSVIVCEANQLPNLQPYKRVPLVNGVESQSISLVAPQQNPENCSYNLNKEMPCNFSISSIYSVGLEEYEKLANDQASQGNESSAGKSINEDPENYLRCEICNIVFTCAKTLKNHKIRYSNTGDYICEICGRRFKWMRAYQKHVTKHRKKKFGTPLWYCETCDEAFATRNSKLMHFSHIHNEFVAPDESEDNPRASLDNTRDLSADANVTSSSLDKSSEKEVYIEEVDLTEDESQEPANSQCVKTTPANSVAVKPTIIQQNRVQLSNYHPMDGVPNLCPIFCNICHIRCMSIEFLVKHIENAHGIRLPGYKENCQVESSVNSTYEQQNITQSSYQSHQDVMRNVGHKIDRIETQSSPSNYCKTCRALFPNEYALLSHLRSAHGNSETGNKTNLDNGNATRSSAQTIEKGQIDGTSRETSFLNSEKQNSVKDSLRNERAMDLTKRKEHIVLKKFHLTGDQKNAYRIIGSKDTHGKVQIISIQKNEIVNLTKK